MIPPSHGLTDDEIAGMITDSLAHAQDDVHARRLAERKVEGGRVLESLESALGQDADLLAPAERRAIGSAEDALRKTLAGEDEAAIKQPDQQTRDFAARRVDAPICRALSGHYVDEV